MDLEALLHKVNSVSASEALASPASSQATTTSRAVTPPQPSSPSQQPQTPQSASRPVAAQNVAPQYTAAPQYAAPQMHSFMPPQPQYAMQPQAMMGYQMGPGGQPMMVAAMAPGGATGPQMVQVVQGPNGQLMLVQPAPQPQIMAVQTPQGIQYMTVAPQPQLMQQVMYGAPSPSGGLMFSGGGMYPGFHPAVAAPQQVAAAPQPQPQQAKPAAAPSQEQRHDATLNPKAAPFVPKAEDTVAAATTQPLYCTKCNEGGFLSEHVLRSHQRAKHGSDGP